MMQQAITASISLFNSFDVYVDESVQKTKNINIGTSNNPIFKEVSYVNTIRHHIGICDNRFALIDEIIDSTYYVGTFVILKNNNTLDEKIGIIRKALNNCICIIIDYNESYSNAFQQEIVFGISQKGEYLLNTSLGDYSASSLEDYPVYNKI